MGFSNKPATYQQVREELVVLQSYGGAAITPLALYELVNFVCMHRHYNRRQIKEMVDVYCALCNEYYVLNHNKKEPKKEFYMAEERWEKYYIPPKTRENAIKRLVDCGLLVFEKKPNPNKRVNKVRMYQIPYELLNALRNIAEEAYPNPRRNKQDFYVALARYLHPVE